MTQINSDGKRPDRSYMRLLRELYGQFAVDKYLEQFNKEEEETDEKKDGDNK